MVKVKRVIYCILIILWLMLIYEMSAKNGTESSGISNRITKCLLTVIPLKQVITYDYLHVFIRKTAHFMEYGVLSILSVLFLLTFRRIKYSIINSKYKLINTYYILIVIFCTINAALDEYHQSFVADREPAVRDVIIDSFGALFFLYIFIKIYTKLSTKKRGNVHN